MRAIVMKPLTRTHAGEFLIVGDTRGGGGLLPQEIMEIERRRRGGWLVHTRTLTYEIDPEDQVMIAGPWGAPK